jgi:hypothetical protein
MQNDNEIRGIPRGIRLKKSKRRDMRDQMNQQFNQMMLMIQENSTLARC